jgi:hypothetical protein
MNQENQEESTLTEYELVALDKDGNVLACIGLGNDMNEAYGMVAFHITYLRDEFPSAVLKLQETETVK